MKHFGWVWFFWLILAECMTGQSVTPTASFVLNFDYAGFRHTEHAGYLELYYGFYARLITYEFRDNRYAAWIKLTTRLKRKETGEVLINQDALLPLSAADTTEASFRYTYVSQAGYSVPHGEYILTVLAEDSLSPNRRDSIALPVSVSSFSGTNMSDLELCSSIKESEDRTDAFYKNSMIVVPNPTVVFGVTANPVLFSYAEVYDVEKDSVYSIKISITDSRNKVVKESSKPRSYKVRNAVEVNTLNCTSLPSGRYRYYLILVSSGGKELAKTSKTFFVYNPHLEVPQASSISMKASELAGFSADELADEFRKAQYVATDQEIKTFSQITSADGRREFLARFWSEVEPGRLGKNPIQRSEYLARVKVADQRYRVMGREGWRTDRGRVFILYGEQDEIERNPSSQELKPYEVWRYFSIENGVEFVFVDRSGFTDYVLVHSTKRGELRDDSWQRSLR